MPETFVIDASVLVKLYANEDASEEARSLLGRAGDPDPPLFLAPTLIYVECANALLKYTRRLDMDRRIAEESISSFARLPINAFDSSEFLPRAFDIAITAQLSLYDALYVALAQIFDAKLVSDDRRLLDAARAMGVDAQSLAEM